jgi:hypothetical protein
MATPLQREEARLAQWEEAVQYVEDFRLGRTSHGPVLRFLLSGPYYWYQKWWITRERDKARAEVERLRAGHPK